MYMVTKLCRRRNKECLALTLLKMILGRGFMVVKAFYQRKPQYEAY